MTQLSRDDADKLAQWYWAEFDRRTKALEEGCGQIGWAHPDYRVSRSDVAHYAESVGIAFRYVYDILDLDAAIKRVRRKRK